MLELKADRVSFRYGAGDRAAVDGLTAVFAEGVTAVVGVNGAGKSTLLQLLARALRPDGGRVLLDGTDVHRARRRQVAHRIALMPQDFRLPPGTRVLDGLAYLAWLRGVRAADAVARSEEQLRRLGLAEHAGARVSALSGGMLRRLALAQALVGRPDVLLLDEPTTGLDPEQRALVRDLLAEPGCRAPITVISSHLMEDVASLADRVLMVDAGSVLFAGSLDEFGAGRDGSSEGPEAAFLRRLLEAHR